VNNNSVHNKKQKHTTDTKQYTAITPAWNQKPYGTFRVNKEEYIPQQNDDIATTNM
jgi:hypothetical protein